ncbi:cytochrome ubiquinol oxidase subunit I [Caulobacter segnis]
MLAVAAIPLPWISTELGWVLAEVGRQPWAVDGVLPTFLGAQSLRAATADQHHGLHPAVRRPGRGRGRPDPSAPSRRARSPARPLSRTGNRPSPSPRPLKEAKDMELPHRLRHPFASSAGPWSGSC